MNQDLEESNNFTLSLTKTTTSKEAVVLYFKFPDSYHFPNSLKQLFSSRLFNQRSVLEAKCYYSFQDIVWKPMRFGLINSEDGKN